MVTFHLCLSTKPLPRVGIPAHSYATLTAAAKVGGCACDAPQLPTCWECAMEKCMLGNKSAAGRHFGEISPLPDQIQHCSCWRAGEGIKQEDPMLSHQLSSEDLTAGMVHRPKRVLHNVKGIGKCQLEPPDRLQWRSFPF